MKLYYSAGARWLSPRIESHEAGLSFEPKRVDVKAKKAHDGGNFNLINDKRDR